MIQTLIRKIRTVLRYLVPPPADREYIATLQTTGQFDRAYYLASNPRLKQLFRIWPVRHYVQLGEANGLCPNPRFSPRAYLFHNPDLARPGLRPLLHYIKTGAAEDRLVLAPLGHGVPTPDDLPLIDASDLPKSPAPVAVVLHIYYADFWEEMAPVLAAQHFAFDLFVTITERDGAVALETRIRDAFPHVRLWRLPNHGRDIFPFVYLVNAGLFAPYAAICKLHSKKSPHRADGDDWRRNLVAGVLGDPVLTQARLTQFQQDENAGFWVSDGQLYEGDEWWGPNRPRAVELLARTNLTADGSLRFPAGSIYWIKPAILKLLGALALRIDDFEPEQALVDGTTPHAIERIMGALAQAGKLEIRQGHDLDNPRQSR